jgi:hypothetical protein
LLLPFAVNCRLAAFSDRPPLTRQPFIFDFKNQIYFIEGLAHSTTNEGAMYRLYTSGDSFSYKKIIEFEDAPEAFAIHNDKLLVATRKNFYLIENLKKIVVYKNILHESLHPNSIAVFDKENIYLGMRGGIAKLDLSKKTLKFYKRNE